MPKLTEKAPSYRLHKPSGQAVVTLSGKDIYLGTYGSKESREAYDREIGEWLSRGRSLAPPPAGLTIAMLVDRFVQFAKRKYRSTDGTVRKEFTNFKPALGILVRMYGDTPAEEFGAIALREWCDHKS